MNGLCLLILLTIRHYGYAAVGGDPAIVWNMLGAAVTIVLVWEVSKPGWARYVALWWTAEELMTIGCNGWYLAFPWPIPAGQDMCSSLIQYDLGKVGTVVVTLLALRASRCKD